MMLQLKAPQRTSVTRSDLPSNGRIVIREEVGEVQVLIRIFIRVVVLRCAFLDSSLVESWGCASVKPLATLMRVMLHRPSLRCRHDYLGIRDRRRRHRGGGGCRCGHRRVVRRPPCRRRDRHRVGSLSG